MIDMNMDIEGIMQECDAIALDEFKGDTEVGYAEARDREKGTHDHISGKMAHKQAVEQYSHKSRPGSRANVIGNDPFSGNSKSDRFENHTRYSKSYAKNMNERLDNRRKNAKANPDLSRKMYGHESVSIFDSLFDQI
jgi:hypothetical protein